MEKHQTLSFLAVFIILLGLYFLVYGGRFHVIDEVSIYAMSENLAKRASLDTDQILWSQWVREPREVQGAFGRGGHVYSKKGFGAALLPSFLVLLGIRHASIGLTFLAFLANPLLTALTALVLALSVYRLGYSRALAVIMGVIYGSATIALPYTRTLFGEPLAAFGLVLALYFILRGRNAVSGFWVFASGIGLSVSIWARSVNALLLPFFWWYLIRADSMKARSVSRLRRLFPKKAIHFVCTVLFVGVGGYIIYDVYRFGAPWKTGYQMSQGEFFTTLPWIGFYGITLSPFRGLLWFSPILVFSIPGGVKFLRYHLSEGILVLSILSTYFVLFSTWWMWWGGFAWGPRFLLPVVPFLVLLIVPLMDSTTWWKAGIAISTGISLVVQFLAVASDFTLSETQLEMLFKHPERSPAMYNPKWSPIVLQAKHLKEGFWDIEWAHAGKMGTPVVELILFSLALATMVLAIEMLYKKNNIRFAFSVELMMLVFSSAVLFVATVMGLKVASRLSLSRPIDHSTQDVLKYLKANARDSQSLVTIAPYDYEAIMKWNHTKMYVLGMSLYSGGGMHPEDRALLMKAEKKANILWLAAFRVHPGDPKALPERFLSERDFVAGSRWFGDIRLVEFFSSNGFWQDPGKLAGDFIFANKIHLRAVTFDKEATSGGFVRVRTEWFADDNPTQSYKIFLHLLTRNGSFVSGIDGIPGNGYLPTFDWTRQSIVYDQRGVGVPEEAPCGEYMLEIGLYDPQTKKRVEVMEGNRKADRVLVRGIRVINTACSGTSITP